MGGIIRKRAVVFVIREVEREIWGVRVVGEKDAFVERWKVLIGEERGC